MVSPETLEQLLTFRREREWEQFHTPKNLAIGIAVEAGELLEQFQWTADAPASGLDPSASLQDEIADVAILLTYLAHDLGINLDAAVSRKLAINAVRYPVARSKGNAVKWRS